MANIWFVYNLKSAAIFPITSLYAGHYKDSLDFIGGEFAG